MVEIPCGDRIALVSNCDAELAMKCQWFTVEDNGNLYTATNIKKRPVRLHRLLLSPSAIQIVDHIDGNGLNNQRENLRIATASQNQMNKRGWQNATSKFKGVRRTRSNASPWQASISMGNGSRRWMKSFSDEIEAAKAYDKKAIEWFGEFARLNFPDAKPLQTGAAQ